LKKKKKKKRKEGFVAVVGLGAMVGVVIQRVPFSLRESFSSAAPPIALLLE
jgi:hypothetical protein